MHIKVAELNTPSGGNGAYHHNIHYYTLDISQIRQFKNGL